jgi:hypothetical protein
MEKSADGPRADILFWSALTGKIDDREALMNGAAHNSAEWRPSHLLAAQRKQTCYVKYRPLL